jgi:hypothetical protein
MTVLLGETLDFPYGTPEKEKEKFGLSKFHIEQQFHYPIPHNSYKLTTD